jgi:cell shape-determining protein MreC
VTSCCTSRYVQTASEKMSYLRELAAKDKEVREKAAAALKDKEEQDKANKENAEFQSRLLEIFK